MLIASKFHGFIMPLEEVPMGKRAKKKSQAARAIYPDMGERMVRIRESTGLTPAAFATFVGFTYTNWHNYEQGYSVPIKSAKQLIAKLPWLTTNYIYEGVPSGPEMARKLGLLPDGDGRDG